MPSPFVNLIIDYATETTLALVRTAVDAIDAKLPATLGSKAAAASLSVTQSTEDAAKVPVLGQALAAASSPVVLPSAQDVVAYAGAASRLNVTLATLPALTTGSATIGAVTGPSAAPLALDATLTGGTARAGVLGADGSGIASAANPVPVVAGTSTTWDVSSRVARLIGAITGKDGTTISSATNGVAVAPETSSTWDVSSRAARLIGALTGVNGSAVATGANPVPMQLSSGSTLYTGATAALSLPIVYAPSLNSTGATLAINGAVIKSGVGTAWWVTITNTTGVSIYWQVFDRASGPPNAGERAMASAPAITANNGFRSGDPIGPTIGLGFANGLLLVASSSPTTYTAIASTGVSYTISYT